MESFAAGASSGQDNHHFCPEVHFFLPTADMGGEIKHVNIGYDRQFYIVFFFIWGRGGGGHLRC